LLAAVLLHGFYDFFIFMGGYFPFFSIGLVIGSWLILNALSKRAAEIDTALTGPHVDETLKKIRPGSSRN
jgi:hypothetical protein